ncbi:hypothetical protein G9A89_003832 [Geosiphon pyriformis]|nr:hypothetical protein G9A89_003832 [Geosiphon pyriformis]
MEPVGSSAGGSGSGLAGLGTRQSAKNKCIDMVYSHGASYKKPKKPAAGILIELFATSSVLGKQSDSVFGSVSGLSDVKSLENLVAKETSYIDSEQLLKAPLFATINDNNDNSMLLPPKINGSNQLLSFKSHILESRSFGPVKLFALDVNLSAVPGRTNSNKLISIKKIFYKIVVNSDLKKANICSNQEVIIKEIPVDFTKLAVESVFSKFDKIVSIRIQLIGLWQKALIEFESSEVASLVTSKWSVFVRKDLVRVALAINDKQTWVSKDCHRVLLYTLPVGTSVHDLSDLLCVIICFENEDARLAAVSTVSIFKGVSLHWASLVLASCTKCEQFGHTTTNCSMGGSSGVHEKRVVSDQNQICLAGIYKKKSAPIACLVSFGGKTWAQVASGISFCVFLSGFPGSGLCTGLVPPSAVSNHLVVSCLNNCLVVLEYSLKLLADHVFGILVKLDFFSVVSLVSSFLAPLSVVHAALSSEVNSDMIVDNTLSSSDITPPVIIDAVVDLSVSSSKVFTAKVGGLKTKLVALKASVGSVLDKLNLLCSGLGLSAPIGINNCAKQTDIVHWHKDMNNMVSIFDGVYVFISGLNSGHMGSGVAIILDSFLAKHVCKVSEVLNKLSVSILRLYAGASLAIYFSQAGEINSLIAKAVNKSSFVILGGDFNKNGFHKCASFKKCFNLGLINSLEGSSFVNDYMLIFSNLVGTVIDHGVDGVEDYFNTDHKAVSVSVGLEGLLNVKLNSLHKQANRDCWKYDIKNANEVKWSEFRDATAANAVMFLDEFVTAKQFSDLDAMWNVVHKIIVLSAGGMFKKKWSKSFNCVFNKVSSQFHKLELLVSKLVKTFQLVSGRNFFSLLNTWDRLDSVSASLMKSLFFFGTGFDTIYSGLAKARKSYCSSKLLKSKCAEEFTSFEVDKDHTIRSVLERSFCKVVLDHLVDGRELVLEPEKYVVASDISGDWARQFRPLDYVFDGAFSDVMHSISFDKMFGVISNLPDGKAAGLSGITNELWKHCDKSVLDMLLVFLNFCLGCELVPGPWREAWISIIPKLYEWEEVLTNTCPIALIETAHKVFSKIFSDWISLACSIFDVFCGNNFSVLKGISTQLPIFAIEHLKKNLIKIKMCDKFIRFFGSIHNGRTNRVIIDFGLTDGYHVYDELDQGKIFLPLLWCIFYDLLLCEVKKQESICDYRLISHFVSKTGWVESQAGLMSFLATGAFVNDTIWVSSSQVAIQHIFNVASDFFHLNDISINNDKTVITPYLIISGLPISIAKRGEPHHYLGIFLFSESLSKPSLVKAHLDFAYLVSSILFPIVSYRTQFSFILLSGLKFKSGLPLDFSNDAESKSAFVIAFANLVGVLGRLFSYRSYNLQILSWHSHHPLLFPVHVRVNPSNNFLAGVICIFSGCNLSLNGSLAGAFHLQSGTPMFLVLSETIFFKCTFKHWKRLDFCGLFPFWFDFSVCFLSGVAFPSGCFSYESSLGFGVICNDLLNVGAACLSVYTDESLSDLGTVDILAGAVVFFEDIDSSLDVRVSGLVSSTLAELQAIALALKNCCWIEYHHIANVICCKNLDVNWIKIKGHSGISGNERADALVKNAVLSAWHLLHLVSERFLKAGVDTVSSNSRHFVHDVFRSIHHMYWEIGSGSQVVSGCLCANIDWLRSSLVWHLNSHMATGFTNIWTAGFRTYFMKALYYRLPVSVQKHLYDREYFSVVCLFCGEVEVSDHVFSCSSDTDNCAGLLDTYATAWEYHESVSVYKDPKVAVVNVVNFVHKFCLVFRDSIWLVHAKHWAIMEKNKLIPCDGFIFVTVSGFFMWLLAGVIRLLGVADALGINFGYCKHYLFYAGVGDMASVHISA